MCSRWPVAAASSVSVAAKNSEYNNYQLIYLYLSFLLLSIQSVSLHKIQTITKTLWIESKFSD